MPENNRKPDYDVCYSERVEKEGEEPKRYAYRIGAAWKGEKGQISIRLAVPVIAPTNLVLFEREEGERSGWR